MERRLVVALVLLFTGAAAITLAAYIFGVFRFDLEIALSIREEQNPMFATFMQAISFFGSSIVPAILVIAAAAVCYLKKMYLEAVFVIGTLSSALIAGVLKFLVGRPRPASFILAPTDIFPSLNQYSYPSGHVLFFVVFFGFTGFLAWKFLSGLTRWIVILICASMILLIGPSRIYLGQHWTSDVIGSYIIGAFCLTVLIILYRMESSRRDEIREKGSRPV